MFCHLRTFFPSTGTPSTLILPFWSGYRPRRMLKSVVLPIPETPFMPILSPFFITAEKFSTTGWRPGNENTIFSIVISFSNASRSCTGVFSSAGTSGAVHAEAIISAVYELAFICAQQPSMDFTEGSMRMAATAHTPKRTCAPPACIP